MGSYQKIWDIEASIRQHPLVASCVVVGEDEPYYSALISPDKAHLLKILEQDAAGGPYALKSQQESRLDSYPRLNSIEIRVYYCDLLEQVNAQAKGKRIERFVLLDFDGNKTREQICAENRHIIESFYQEYIAGVG